MWSKKHNKCVDCGETKTRHCGKGLCETCYCKQRRRKKGIEDRSKVCEHLIIDGIECALCRHCSSWKATTEFGKGNRRRDGLKSFCKECENAYYRGKRTGIDQRQAAKRKKRKNERKQEILLTQNGCDACGLIVFEMSIYDFHHIDPTKKQHWMADIINRANDLWEQEVEKCALLCAVCHRLAHKFIRRENNYANIPYSKSRRADVERRTKRASKRKLSVLDIQGGCNLCGLSYREARLYDFHHKLSFTKEKTAAGMIQYANEKWQEEANKCILVCVNCHRLIHAVGLKRARDVCERSCIRENYFCSA